MYNCQKIVKNLSFDQKVFVKQLWVRDCQQLSNFHINYECKVKIVEFENSHVTFGIKISDLALFSQFEIE